MRRGPYQGSINWQLRQLSIPFVRGVIESSISIREVFERLGFKIGGSSYPALKQYAKDNDISLEHFLGRHSSKGAFRGFAKLTFDPEKTLVLRKNKGHTGPVKRALLAVGRPYICEECELGPEWNGKKLVLQVDHKSGNRLDDRRENVRFLCPNCHSQTDTFTSKNKKKSNAPSFGV